MTTGRSKMSDRQPPTSEIPWSGIVVFSVIGGIVLIGILSAAIAGATPKGILTNLGFYVSIAIVFAVLALGFNLQWGYTGLFNAGIAGFYLIGAYVAAFAITPPAPPIIVGGVVVAPKASELIFPVALAVQQKLTVDQVASAFTIYPSLSGSIAEAARQLHVRA